MILAIQGINDNEEYEETIFYPLRRHGGTAHDGTE
jgi:hypothetical protein